MFIWQDSPRGLRKQVFKKLVHAGLTIDELASACNLCMSTVAAYRNRWCGPQKKSLKAHQKKLYQMIYKGIPDNKIAAYFHVSPRTILVIRHNLGVFRHSRRHTCTCVDCKNVFKATLPQTKRCPECRMVLVQKNMAIRQFRYELYLLQRTFPTEAKALVDEMRAKEDAAFVRLMIGEDLLQKIYKIF